MINAKLVVNLCSCDFAWSLRVRGSGSGPCSGLRSMPGPLAMSTNGERYEYGWAAYTRYQIPSSRYGYGYGVATTMTAI